MHEADVDTIPLADVGPDDPRQERSPEHSGHADAGRSRKLPSQLTKWLAPALIVILSSAHTAAIWFGLGGLEGMTNGWPIWRFDHPLYYHSAIVTRAFLKESWTTAGYDPFFMSGYAKSVIYPSSSTLPELVIAIFGENRPALAYKIYVLVSAAAFPWLIALACAIWRMPSSGSSIAVAIALIYVWTDFPISYVGVGMLPYFLGIPLALVAISGFARFLIRGGAINWLLAASLLSLAFLAHLTTAMVCAPAAAMAYIARSSRHGNFINGSILIAIIAAPIVGYLNMSVLQRAALALAAVSLAAVFAQIKARTDQARAVTRAPRRLPSASAQSRRLGRAGHLAVWALPLVILAVNAFWWLPGAWLASTKGPSDFAFAHPEGVMRRLAQIGSTEPPIQCLLIAAGLPGLFLLLRRDAVLGWACIGFCAAGFGWGYLAGASRSLDFLQPGRHTFAFYSGMAVAAGIALDELRKRLRAGKPRLDGWALAATVLIGIRMIGFPGYPAIVTLRGWFVPEPFLTSRPTPRALWIVDRVGLHVKPGERLLYEEAGFSVKGAPEPFQGGRLSGVLPERTGVELIGGPYLHASLKTNFTQFGEGKLCGKPNWTRDDFIRYAKLYGPSAILCWSPHARRFCKENPDLIRILDDDKSMLLGRIIGFEGHFLKGSGKVEAEAGVLRLRELTPGLDGTIVLRYHSVPYLRARPAVAIEHEYREDDPVPFIRLRPPPGMSEVELTLQVPFGR